MKNKDALLMSVALGAMLTGDDHFRIPKPKLFKVKKGVKGKPKKLKKKKKGNYFTYN